MKICFFTENYHKGGLDTFLINLINAWPNLDDELTVVCNSTHPGIETITSKVRRRIVVSAYSRLFTSSLAKGLSSFMGASLLRRLFSLSYRVLQYPVLFPWYVLSLAVYFRRHRFDRLMVVNGGYPASLLCRCAAIGWKLAGMRPLAIFNYHNSATRAPWYFPWPEYLVDRLVIAASAKIVTVSKNCQDSLSIRNAFLNCPKLRYIYNGIEDPVRQLAGQARDDRGRYCLMLATYEARKGHKFLLKAFRLVADKFPEVQLRIYGHGTAEDRKVVADEVNKLSLWGRVSLNDFTDQTASLLSNATLLVVPSQAYESFGLTIVEAMAFSTPVITTDVGGMPEVMAESNAGYVCERHDFVKFAEAINTILGNSVFADELGRNGRLTFERKFISQTMAAQYQLIISEDE